MFYWVKSKRILQEMMYPKEQFNQLMFNNQLENSRKTPLNFFL